ncbi:short chain dehydrogenase family protein [Paraburkholderia xenovorans LB400]|uniref:Glucose 1-dehydrogenase n=1 Tax=Paraburkholderia xenovorans (strain LB400) TaxID=266265 RepID=Q13K85_PARXL|nr:SDR family oxidoreductase [Paraburkholderia xenovorans]ABE35504.1 glucose 1-dehydrogenase [Paraburkholderia xenovorans LB400]AIP37928.1 short chain dehydrogenase family protein [Paraburkholderia xenovorans LB400]
MEKLLANQVALVTGASSGIGYGVATALAGAGAAVVVNYHSHGEAAEQLVSEIETAGGAALAVQADVSDPAQVEAMFAACRARFESVDIVVANSGMQKDSAFADMTLDDWQQVLSTNLTGQFLTAQAAVKEFRRRGPRPASRALGKIICMSSVHEVIPWAGHVNYAASKGGVQMFMKSLAQEVAPERIRVNSIAPGAIRTPINKDAWDTDAALQKLLKLIPYRRVGESQDIGKAAVWLASDESDYVVGTTLFVDGGMTLYPGFDDNG